MIVDINNINSRTISDSADLGKHSQLQSVAINQKCTTYGIATFDGRANISMINRNASGLFAPVSMKIYRNL
jgi:hypothetical protein